jgi:hypothetical protein
LELQEWLLRLCRKTALHRASQEGHTATAMALVEAGADVRCKTNDGYGSALGLHARVVVGSPQCEGLTVRALELELQEWPLRLCRRTAVHSASQEGHTETAMALVKAGADVHCKTNDGYSSRVCLLVSLGCHRVEADGPSTPGRSCRSSCFCCAGGQRCTRRRRRATRRR